MDSRRNRSIRLWVSFTMLAAALTLTISLGLSTDQTQAGTPAGKGAGADALKADAVGQVQLPLNTGNASSDSGTVSQALFAPFVPRAPGAPSVVGDLLYSFNVENTTTPIFNVALGAEHIGGFYWVTGRSLDDNVKKLVKLNLDGVFVAQYIQEACAASTFGYRDLAFDGTHIYTADECGIDRIDPATGTVVTSNIPNPSGVTLVRSLAYDPVTGEFFTANFSTATTVFTIAGSVTTVVRTLPNPGSPALAFYGAAFDRDSPGNPYYWGWSQNAPDGTTTSCTGAAGTPNCLKATRMNPTTGALTGLAFDGVGTVSVTGGDIAGGADIDVISSTLSFVGFHQAVSDTIRIYDLTGPTGTPTTTPLGTNTATHTPTRTITPTPFCTPNNYAVVSGTATMIPGVTDIGNHADDLVTTIALPFPFTFYKSVFNSVGVSSNGNMQFTSTSTLFTNTCLPNATMNNLLAPYWDDQHTGVNTGCATHPGGVCGIFTAILGTAPNRTFVIEWRTVFFADTASALNYEVLLHEGSSTFEIVYGASAGVNANGISATSGTQQGDGAGGVFTQYSCLSGVLTNGLQTTWSFTLGDCPTSTPTRTPTITLTRTITPTRTITLTRTNTLTRTVTPTITPGGLTFTPTCVPNAYTVATGTATIIPGVTDTGNHADDLVTTIALPFPFTFYKSVFNSVGVSSNGNMQFTTVNTAFTNVCLPTATMNNLLAPYWDDQRTDVNPGCATHPGGVCGIFTAILGTAPNRTFVIEWRTVFFADTASAVNYEVLLHEGSSTFEIVYGASAGVNANGVSATSGTQQGTGAAFTQYSCDSAVLTNGLQTTWSLTLGTCPSPTPAPSNTPINTPTASPTQICPGSWTSQAVYPIGILDSGVTSVGGNLYSFAGVSASAIIATSYKYDPGSNTWTGIAALPAAREQPSSVSDGTYAYTLGGADSVGANTNTLYRYDPVGNTYTTMAPFTVATWAQAAAYLNGKIYKVAGCGANCTTYLNSVEEYDIVGNIWTTKAAYPESVGWLMCTALGNFVYCGGGTGASGESLKTYRYDPVGNVWSDADIADLPETRWGSAEDNLKGKWLLSGGYRGGVIVASSLAWDPNTNTWAGIDPMPIARARMSGATVGVQYYSIGGRDPVIGGFAGTNNNQRHVNICQAPTATPTPNARLRGHVIWQQIPQNDARSQLPITLTLKSGATEASYTVPSTDDSGYFTVTVAGLAMGPNVVYDWRVQGPDGGPPGGGNITPGFLANCGQVNLTGAPLTTMENSQVYASTPGCTVAPGCIRGGDANNDNIVSIVDFNTLKLQFNTPGPQADFNNDGIVSIVDFNILKSTFNLTGCSALGSPGSQK